MKTKLLTAAVAVLLMTSVLQTVRIERQKTNYARLEVTFAEYKQKHNQTSLDDLQADIDGWKAKATQREKENEQLQNDKRTLAANFANSQRLRQQDRKTIYHLTQTANQGTCEDARQALRVCTNLHTISSGGSETLERLAGIYGTYADQLEAELRLCR